MKNENKQLPTQGEWKYEIDGGRCKINGGNIDVWGYSNSERTYADAQNDAQAICTAINNTYGKGINPEAIPLAFQLLEMAKCPECDGSGVIVKEVIRTGTKWVDDGNGTPLPEPYPIQDFEPEPCKWCYERESIKKPEL